MHNTCFAGPLGTGPLLPALGIPRHLCTSAGIAQLFLAPVLSAVTTYIALFLWLSLAAREVQISGPILF